jgi:hypothetical protein
MFATFTPYFQAQAHRDPTGSGAYIRVRVTDGPVTTAPSSSTFGMGQGLL